MADARGKSVNQISEGQNRSGENLRTNTKSVSRQKSDFREGVKKLLVENLERRQRKTTCSLLTLISKICEKNLVND